MWFFVGLGIAFAVGAVSGLVLAVRDCLEDDEVILRVSVDIPELKSSAPP